MQMRAITDADMAAYRKLGFMLFGPILTRDELGGLRRHVDEMVANLPEGKRPEGMNMPHPDDPYLLELCRHPRILDVIEQFLGPDIVLFASHIICKPGGDGQPVPWHQDSTYWPLDPMRVMTLWLAVDDSTVENGCMRVIPRSHVHGALKHQNVENPGAKVLHLEVGTAQFDESSAVDLEMKAGECSFHEPDLVHGSNPNHSPTRRCGYTIRYMPASARLNLEPGFWENHPLYLVHGRDPGVNALMPDPAGPR